MVKWNSAKWIKINKFIGTVIETVAPIYDNGKANMSILSVKIVKNGWAYLWPAHALVVDIYKARNLPLGIQSDVC